MPSSKKLKPIPDVTTQVVAARFVLKQVRALEAEIPGVLAAEDLECIHRMRVASRRLRANLNIFKPVFPPKPWARWLSSVRSLTRALGAARDLDVQIDHVAATIKSVEDPSIQRGLRRLHLRLLQKRSRRQKAVSRAVTAWQKNGAAKDIYTRIGGWESRLPSGSIIPSMPLGDLACETILDRLSVFLGYAACLDDPADITSLHAMRIAAKWLRYSLESFDAIWPDSFTRQLTALRTAQETLGTIHDCDVWAEMLPRMMAREERLTKAYFGNTRPVRRILPGMEYYLTLRAQDRSRLFEKYNADWADWQSTGLWEDLRAAVMANCQPPVEPNDAPAPASAGE